MSLLGSNSCYIDNFSDRSNEVKDVKEAVGTNIESDLSRDERHCRSE